MALYRVVHTGFWRDEKVLEEMTPEDKLYFLYLLTNPNTTQIGIYKITKKEMAFDLGYSMESINSLLERFENHHKLVRYNANTREIGIKNWGRHNLNKAGTPILDCVKKELCRVKDVSLVEYVGESMTKVKVKVIFDDFLNDYYKNSYNYEIESLSNDTLKYKFNDTLKYKSEVGRQKEKEKENKKEKENVKEKEIQKEIQKQKSESVLDKNSDNNEESSLENNKGTRYIGKFAKLYEQNIGLINGVAYEWLCNISDDIDEELFKKAIEIATDVGKCNKGYVNGIIRQWSNNNIRCYSDYEAHELKRKERGATNGYESEEDEDELYRRPTEEELEAVKKWLN